MDLCELEKSAPAQHRGSDRNEEDQSEPDHLATVTVRSTAPAVALLVS